MSDNVVDYAIAILNINRKDKHMGKRNKISNMLQDLKGKGKEALGSTVGNKEMENKGKVEQTKAGLKDAGENVKDAASNVKDAASDAKDAITGT